MPPQSLPLQPPSPPFSPLPPGQLYVPAVQSFITFTLNETAISFGPSKASFKTKFSDLVGCNFEPDCQVLLLSSDGKTISRRLQDATLDLTVHVILYHETNTSAPVMLAVKGLQSQTITWLDKHLDVHIIAVAHVEAATVTTLPKHVAVNNNTFNQSERDGLALVLPLVIFAGIVLVALTCKIASSRRVCELALFGDHKPEEATTGEFDIFLSYRVASDAPLAEKLYDKLSLLGLKVWWDAKCLPRGLPWEEGFADGLFASKVFLCILSKTSLAPLTDLSTDSRCDNVLLELLLGLTLIRRGDVTRIVPVLVGEVEQHPDLGAFHGDFFTGGGVPTCGDVVVDSVTAKAADHLTRAGKQTLDETLSVKAIIEGILAHQGAKLIGPQHQAIEHVVTQIQQVLSERRINMKRTQQSAPTSQGELSVLTTSQELGGAFVESSWWGRARRAFLRSPPTTGIDGTTEAAGGDSAATDQFTPGQTWRRLFRASRPMMRNLSVLPPPSDINISNDAQTDMQALQHDPASQQRLVTRLHCALRNART